MATRVTRLELHTILRNDYGQDAAEMLHRDIFGVDWINDGVNNPIPVSFQEIRMVATAISNRLGATQFISERLADVLLATRAPALTNTRPVRTVEQEIAWRRYNEQSSDGETIFNNAQGAEYARLNAMLACPTPIPPRIRVKVKYNRIYGSWEIIVKVDSDPLNLPSIQIVRSLLPPEFKRYLGGVSRGRRHSTEHHLNTALNSGLPAQVLHDSLKAWAMAFVASSREASSETVAAGESDPGMDALLKAMPATLEYGGKVFRLVPSNEIDTRPLVRRIREKALNGAKVEATGIKNRAQTDARIIVSEAQFRANREREEIEALRAELRDQMPSWIRESGRPTYLYTTSYWAVQMMVGCEVREIRYMVRGWNVVIKWNPVRKHGSVDRDGVDHNRQWYNDHKIAVWVKISQDGGYTFDGCFMREFDTTHIIQGDGYTCCMRLQTAPTSIRSVTDLEKLEQALTRGMQVVNLNSPLGKDATVYHPYFREQLPEMAIKKLHKQITFLDGRDVPLAPNPTAFKALFPAITWDATETILAEASSTFDVDNPVPVPVAPVPVNPDAAIDTIPANPNPNPNPEVTNAR